jgi:hypothetical protein
MQRLPHSCCCCAAAPRACCAASYTEARATGRACRNKSLALECCGRGQGSLGPGSLSAKQVWPASQPLAGHTSSRPPLPPPTGGSFSWQLKLLLPQAIARRELLWLQPSAALWRAMRHAPRPALGERARLRNATGQLPPTRHLGAGPLATAGPAPPPSHKPPPSPCSQRSLTAARTQPPWPRSAGSCPPRACTTR